jgi:NADPH:quinone reductase-like Zn-dependent oxidoreductase
VKADGAVVKTPEALSDTEAAALPFGAMCRWSSSTGSRA